MFPRIHNILLCHVERHPALAAALKGIVADPADGILRLAAETEMAIEWCENFLLLQPEELAPKATPEIDQFDIVDSLNREQIAVLNTMLHPGRAEDQEYIVREGDESNGLYFLLRGTASVTIEPEPGKTLRLGTCSPVMTFGEMALLDRKPRSASVRADGIVDYLLLPLAEFERLRADRPDIALKLLENLSRGLSDKLRRANAEIRALGA